MSIDRQNTNNATAQVVAQDGRSLNTSFNSGNIEIGTKISFKSGDRLTIFYQRLLFLLFLFMLKDRLTQSQVSHSQV
jgi:hypothetical protein